jgi:hypothetical protein
VVSALSGDGGARGAGASDGDGTGSAGGSQLIAQAAGADAAAQAPASADAQGAVGGTDAQPPSPVPAQPVVPPPIDAGTPVPPIAAAGASGGSGRRPPAPAATKYGKLVVTGVAPAVDVFVNGKRRCNTPCEIPLSVGTHRITLRKQDPEVPYNERNFPVTILENQTVEVSR